MFLRFLDAHEPQGTIVAFLEALFTYFRRSNLLAIVLVGWPGAGKSYTVDWIVPRCLHALLIARTADVPNPLDDTKPDAIQKVLGAEWHTIVARHETENMHRARALLRVFNTAVEPHARHRCVVIRCFYPHNYAKLGRGDSGAADRGGGRVLALHVTRKAVSAVFAQVLNDHHPDARALLREEASKRLDALVDGLWSCRRAHDFALQVQEWLVLNRPTAASVSRDAVEQLFARFVADRPQDGPSEDDATSRLELCERYGPSPYLASTMADVALDRVTFRPKRINTETRAVMMWEVHVALAIAREAQKHPTNVVCRPRSRISVLQAPHDRLPTHLVSRIPSQSRGNASGALHAMLNYNVGGNVRAYLSVDAKVYKAIKRVFLPRH
eukprot:TRINITY_DN792_c0_g1_i4.p2 TRINITY_DN792_c0_g1~~TRINITY_DN792_c0_g1_i4.p2  ORF type:complete len:384 (-),score=38.74 TRINITY_DN792_c0_g1_i4:5531-6682(-)